MSRWASLPAFLFPLWLGCAPATGTRTTVSTAYQPGESQRRVGVLPFADAGDRGREVAIALTHSFWRRERMDPVEVSQLEAVFARLRLEINESYNKRDLADIRAATYVDALVVGSLDTAPRKPGAADGPADRGASAVMMDTRTGETLASVRLPAAAVARKSAQQIADAVIDAITHEVAMRSVGLRPGEEPDAAETR